MISAATQADNEPAPRPSGVWDYLSATRLNLWAKCPLAFRLRYLDGLVTPPHPAAFVGKLVHAGLERFYRHRQLGVVLDPIEIVDHVRSAWDRLAAGEHIRFACTADESAAQQQVGALLTCYLAQHAADEPRPLAVEAMLEAPLVDPTTGAQLGIPLVGIIDLVLDGPQGPTIVDFKTTSRSAPPCEQAHEVQLSCYAWLFRVLSGQAEAGLEIRSLVKTKTPRVETRCYAARRPAQLARLFALIRAYLDDLDRNRFVYRPGPACASCEYRASQCFTWAGE